MTASSIAADLRRGLAAAADRVSMGDVGPGSGGPVRAEEYAYRLLSGFVESLAERLEAASAERGTMNAEHRKDQ